MTSVPIFLESLETALAQCHRFLEDAVVRRDAPMHTPVVSTLGLDGHPRSRVVVLRAFDAVANALRFHTDLRSNKARELIADQRIALLFYDPQEKMQIRIEGRATLHSEDALANEAWRLSQAMSKLCYATEPAPGVPLSEADDFELPRDRAAAESGRTNFMAVSISVTALEWLWLGAGGHRRARYLFADLGMSATWLVP